jgi:hypothetical protein
LGAKTTSWDLSGSSPPKRAFLNWKELGEPSTYRRPKVSSRRRIRLGSSFFAGPFFFFLSGTRASMDFFRLSDSSESMPIAEMSMSLILLRREGES